MFRAHKNGSSLCPPFPFYVSKGKICDSSVGVILDFGENENHTAGYLARLLALSMSTHQGNDKCTNPPKGCMNWKIFENTWYIPIYSSTFSPVLMLTRSHSLVKNFRIIYSYVEFLSTSGNGWNRTHVLIN